MVKVRKFALLTSQGTACPETVLTAPEFTDKNKQRIETEAAAGMLGYIGSDRPVPGTWTDVTNNDAC